MTRYERIIKAHPEIEAWLRNRPRNTQRGFSQKLLDFSKAMKISPEDWRKLDKFEARDLAWRYIEPLIAKNASVAVYTMTALKSWFRNLRGEKLPFDSGRGGKHQIRYIQKKAATEHIPNKEEFYRILDMASSLRDKAILLTLFQSGVRVNALCSLKYGDVKDQLDKDVIVLKITWNLDEKLRGTQIPFYFTFLNGESAITLKQFCALNHKKSKPETPLFFTRSKKHVSQKWVWKIVKNCVKRAGFDEKSMTTHTLRKAFRKVVRQSPTDDEFKEMITGHVLRGARESYFDRHDRNFFKEEYQKCDFSREVPESEVTKLRKQLEEERGKRMTGETRIENLERQFESIRKELQEVLAQKK